MAILTNKEVVEITYNGTALPMPTTGSAFIVVTSRPNAVLTCDSQTYTLGANETHHAFEVALGTHSVTVTIGSTTQTESVVVSSLTVYYVDITSKIPSTYQEVAWIGATGTQYLLTTYYPKASSVFAAKVEKNTENTNVMWFGCRSGGSYDSYNQQCYFNTNGAATGTNKMIHLFSTTSKEDDPVYANNWSSNSTPVAGTAYEYDNITCTSTMQNMTYPIAMFALNNKGTIAGLSDCKLYYVSVKENGTKMAEWIPCYNKTSGVIGMYETVSGTFLTNAGSGTFTKGADVN